MSGHAAGPLFRRVLRGGHGSSEPLGADGIRGIVRKRVAAVPGSTAGESAGTRSGWVARESLRPPERAWQSCSKPGGWRSPDTPEVYIRLKAARGPVARGAATGWAGSNTLYRAGLPANRAAAKCQPAQPACTARPYLDEQAYSLLRMTGEQTGTYVQATR